MLGEAGEAAVLALMVIFAVIALVLGAALLQIRHELPRGLGATLRDAVGWSALATLCGRHAPVGDADAAGRGAGSLALGAKPRGADHVVIGEGGGDAFGRSGAGGALRHRPSRVLKADDITEDKTYEWEIDVTRLSMKRIIGKGNFGEVWYGLWLGSPVAIKTLLPSLVNDQKLVKRFIDEILLMSLLHHPNVVMFLGASIRKPHLCLVLEYCSYGSLHHFLRAEKEHRVKITMSHVLRFAVDIARGVLYLHKKQSIVQRDLKARNVLVDSSLNAKVADFGLSRVLTDEDEAKLTACGTPAWTAPEIVRMEPYTEKVDVYSFGIILWELFTRDEPYGGTKGVQIAYLAAEQNLRPTIPSYCPSDYAELMQSCWDANPDRRPNFETIIKSLFEMKKAGDAAAAEAAVSLPGVGVHAAVEGKKAAAAVEAAAAAAAAAKASERERTATGAGASPARALSTHKGRSASRADSVGTPNVAGGAAAAAAGGAGPSPSPSPSPSRRREGDGGSRPTTARTQSAKTEDGAGVVTEDAGVGRTTSRSASRHASASRTPTAAGASPARSAHRAAATAAMTAASSTRERTDDGRPRPTVLDVFRRPTETDADVAARLAGGSAAPEVVGSDEGEEGGASETSRSRPRRRSGTTAVAPSSSRSSRSPSTGGHRAAGRTDERDDRSGKLPNGRADDRSGKLPGASPSPAARAPRDVTAAGASSASSSSSASASSSATSLRGGGGGGGSGSAGSASAGAAPALPSTSSAVGIASSVLDPEPGSSSKRGTPSGSPSASPPAAASASSSSSASASSSQSSSQSSSSESTPATQRSDRLTSVATTRGVVVMTTIPTAPVGMAGDSFLALSDLSSLPRNGREEEAAGAAGAARAAGAGASVAGRNPGRGSLGRSQSPSLSDHEQGRVAIDIGGGGADSEEDEAEERRVGLQHQHQHQHQHAPSHHPSPAHPSPSHHGATEGRRSRSTSGGLAGAPPSGTGGGGGAGAGAGAGAGGGASGGTGAGAAVAAAGGGAGARSPHQSSSPSSQPVSTSVSVSASSSSAPLPSAAHSSASPSSARGPSLPPHSFSTTPHLHSNAGAGAGAGVGAAVTAAAAVTALSAVEEGSSERGTGITEDIIPAPRRAPLVSPPPRATAHSGPADAGGAAAAPSASASASASAATAAADVHIPSETLRRDVQRMFGTLPSLADVRTGKAVPPGESPAAMAEALANLEEAIAVGVVPIPGATRHGDDDDE